MSALKNVSVSQGFKFKILFEYLVELVILRNPSGNLWWLFISYLYLFGDSQFFIVRAIPVMGSNAVFFIRCLGEDMEGK